MFDANFFPQQAMRDIWKKGLLIYTQSVESITACEQRCDATRQKEHQSAVFSAAVARVLGRALSTAISKEH